MRFRNSWIRATAALLVLSALASGSQQVSPAQRLQESIDKADKANEREQCHLYADVVRDLVEIAERQNNDNDLDKLQQTTKDIVTYAEKCRAAAHKSNHKLKDAEITLRKAERRLADLAHAVPYESRPPVTAAVDRISAVRSDILQQMFKR